MNCSLTDVQHNSIFQDITQPYHDPKSGESIDCSKIRLITLYPGQRRDNVQISLSTAILDPSNPPVYEALSYVWGSENSLEVIFYNYS
jgi:hypothetical protein